MGYVESLLGHNEQIVFATRRHWLVMGRTLLTMGLLGLVIIAASAALGVLTGGPGLVGLVLLVFPLARLTAVFLEWLNEQYIVTNRRIIQVEGIFNKHVVDSSLEKVNDVVLDQSFWGRLWGYGDIEILTASELGVNKLQMLAQPLRFKTTMLNQKERLVDVAAQSEGEAKAKKGGRPITPIAPEDVPGLISQLARLRDLGILTQEEFEAKKARLLEGL